MHPGTGDTFPGGETRVEGTGKGSSNPRKEPGKRTEKKKGGVKPPLVIIIGNGREIITFCIPTTQNDSAGATEVADRCRNDFWSDSSY